MAALLVLASARSVYLLYLDSAQFRCRSVALIAMKETGNLAMIRLSERQYKESRSDENEVKINGVLFDVDRVIHSGDSVTLFVLHDIKEEEILNAISCLIETKETVNTDGAFTHLSKVPVCSINDWKIVTIDWQPGCQIFFQDALRHFDCYSYNKFNTGFHSPVSPPPRPCC